MRSIEFRGYLNGEVVTDLLLYEGSFYNGWRAFEDGIVFEAPVVQFTGLKDKNEKKIFEGDRVKCVDGHVGVVEWEDNDCCFNVSGYYSSSDDYPTMAFMEGQPFEVIGNIHTEKKEVK